MRNYPCRQPLASSSLLPASSSPPPASSSTPSALGFLLPASCTPLQTLRFLLYALSVQFSTHASNSPLPALRSLLPALLHSASDFLPPALSALSPLLPALSALCPQPSAFCSLLLAHSASTLYSLLSTHCFCALSSQLSALCPQPSAFCSLSFNRHPPKNGLPGSCIGGVRAAALPHTEKNACGVRPHVAPPRYLSATSLPSLHPG